MKKKYTVTPKDKKDWVSFTRQISDISPKKIDILSQNTKINEVRKLDLHGSSLTEANKAVKKFIIESYNIG